MPKKPSYTRPQKNLDSKRVDGTIPMFVFALLLIFLGAELTPAAYGNIPKRFPVLAACTRFEYNIFKGTDFDDFKFPEVTTVSDVSRWTKQYHETVSGVVDEVFGGTPGPPICTAPSYEGLLPLSASPQLGELASSLPSWNSLTWQVPPAGTDPGDFDADPDLMNTNASSLSQLDVGTVLLEYLRMYECALVERSLFLIKDTYNQEQNRDKRMDDLKIEISDDALKSLLIFLKRRPLNWAMYVNFVSGDRQIILSELTQARRSLNRTLTFLAGFNRMRPIDIELKCLQQASLDVRNGLALAADASSCLPRIWNSKDVLRDYK